MVDDNRLIRTGRIRSDSPAPLIRICLFMILRLCVVGVLVMIVPPRGSSVDVVIAMSVVAGQTQKQQLNIAFVTGNAMKVKEVEMILNDEGAMDVENPEQSLVSLRVVNVDLPEIQEVNTEGIAKEKVLLAAQLAGGPALIEDTSLQFKSLGGMPGPYIKWFQDTLKSDGLWRILAAYEDKSATAVCTLAFCTGPHADPVLFTGRVEGKIVEPIEGRGFGWDSIFVPDGEDQPFSCLSTERKNTLSHRGNAVRKWVKWLFVNKEAVLERQSGLTPPGHKGLDFKSTSPEE